MTLRTVWRKSLNIVMLSLTGVCALITVSALIVILGYLARNGATALHWSFFTNLPAPVGETGGGIANAITGSAKLLLLATLVGVPIGLLGAIYVAEYASPVPAFVVRYATDLLNGVPSIVMGIFAWTIVVVPMHSFSAYAGGFALGVMMVPIILRSSEEFLRTVPRSLREGAMALGTSKWRTIATVVVPAAAGGIVTAILLSLSRVAGETAPLLFTAFGNRFWSHGWNEPVASLPVVIYTYAVSPYDDWHRQAWAAGLVLLGLVLVTNLVCRALLARRATQRR
ncbi:MAG TPA: phosphate ABC transporter permease PstA [Methylomirabilota bacterium]|nr:phosphate ABC transporter permease PstA [Methylomirabilota bacterium]